MRVVLSEYASKNKDEPNIKWFINDEYVKNILLNANSLNLCHIKALKQAVDFTNEYIWDNTSKQPIAIFEYSFFENLIKKFKKTKSQIQNMADFKILDINVEIFSYQKRFKLFLYSEVLPFLKEFIKIANLLNLDENYMIFFNKNIEKQIYYTFEGLEKAVFMATIADRLFFVQDRVLYINEFYLIHKNGEKVLINRQKIGNIADEIF